MELKQAAAPALSAYEAEEDLIDFKEIISLVLNHRWAILLTVFSFIFLAAFYCKLETPVYQANILMNTNVNAGSNSLSGLLGGTGAYFNFAQSSSSQTEEQILSSRSVLEPVVNKLHLDVHVIPRYFPVLGHAFAREYDAANFANTPKKPWLGFAQYDWGGNQINVSHFEVSDDLKGQRFLLQALSNTTYQLISPAGKLLLTGEVGKSYTIQPTIIPGETSQLSLQVLNIHANSGAEFYLTQQRMTDAIDALNARLKVVDNGKLTNLLQIQLTGTDPDLTAQILNEVGNSAVLFDVNSQAVEASKTLNFLRSRIPDVKQALDLAEKRLNDYLAQSGNIALTDEGKMLLQKMADLETQASALQVQKAQLEQQYTDQSFQVQQIQTALDQLNTEKASLEAEIKKLPPADQIQVGLTRDADVQNKIYVNLLDKIQEFEILQAGTIGKVAIIDEAAVPYKSINKPPMLVIGLAGFLGFFLSMGFFFVRQFLFRGIEDPDLVETKLGLSVFGAIQESQAQVIQLKQLENRQIKHLSFLAELDPQDLIVESLRSLRTNLLFELPKAKNNIIAISGPTPGVGKSFISVNFAQVLADAGYKVLFVDADIRRGAAHNYFNVERFPGFCDVIDNKVSLDDAIHNSRIQNLDFLSTGTFPRKHAEFLMRPKVEEILKELSQRYDYVVFDTAPILAVTDALHLFKHAGTHLLVLAYGRHDLSEIEHTLSQFEKGGVSINGCIFNRIKLSHVYYGKKYKYHYRYQYAARKE